MRRKIKSDNKFEKIWEIYVMNSDRPDTGRGLGRPALENLCEVLNDMMYSAPEYWAERLNEAVVASNIHYRRIPDDVMTRRQEIAAQIVDMIHTVRPDLSYITIQFRSSISGGDSCIPNIEVRIDNEWFGYDPAMDDPWHTKHSTGAFDISYDCSNIQGYQNSKPDAKPRPTFQELCPACENWKRDDNEWYDRRNRRDALIFFPEGESFRRN